MSWIDRVKDLDDTDALRQEMDGLTSDHEINLIGAYEIAQKAAGEYKDRKEEIPRGLVRAILGLGNAPSGYTGLTVYEAFVYLKFRK